MACGGAWPAHLKRALCSDLDLKWCALTGDVRDGIGSRREEREWKKCSRKMEDLEFELFIPFFYFCYVWVCFDIALRTWRCTLARSAVLDLKFGTWERR